MLNSTLDYKARHYYELLSHTHDPEHGVSFRDEIFNSIKFRTFVDSVGSHTTFALDDHDNYKDLVLMGERPQTPYPYDPRKINIMEIPLTGLGFIFDGTPFSVRCFGDQLYILVNGCLKSNESEAIREWMQSQPSMMRYVRYVTGTHQRFTLHGVWQDPKKDHIIKNISPVIFVSTGSPLSYTKFLNKTTSALDMIGVLGDVKDMVGFRGISFDFTTTEGSHFIETDWYNQIKSKNG